MVFEEQEKLMAAGTLDPCELISVTRKREQWVALLRGLRQDPNQQPQLGRRGWMLISFIEAVLTGENMATGKVKWFNDQKGYGFITPDSGGKDLFVHHSAIKMNGFRSLSEGQSVEFEKVTDQKGEKAVNVKPK